MRRRSIRCYRGFAATPGKANIEVFYTLADFGYSKELFVCTECGALFVIDFDNPDFAGKTAKQIAAGAACPVCSESLSETIRPYPETFRTDDGRIGHFKPSRIIPPDSESLVKEFWEIGV